MILRPVQQAALEAAADAAGLLAHIGVGHGKTAICALLPDALRARRPLLLVPASVVAQTRSMRAELGTIPDCVVWSYERLGHPSHSGDLDALAPDAVILDEAHMVRGDSARRRRLARYVRDHAPRVAVLSGTLLRPEISGTCELARWALGDVSPLPSGRDARGLEQFLRGTASGATFARWARRLGISNPLARLRGQVALGRGCVVSDGLSCALPLTLRTIPWALAPSVVDALAELAETWALPGLQLVDAMAVAGVRRTLHCGYYYRWAEAPSDEWLRARSVWAHSVRQALKRPRPGLDSEALLWRACAAGRLDLEGWREWGRWRRTPPPPTEAVWLDDALIRDAAARALPLTWYQHRAEAAALEALGVPVAPLGRTPQSGPVAVSVRGHGTGRNLQWAASGITLAPLTSAEAWEQLLGRTHRQGQTEPVEHATYVSTATVDDLDGTIDQALALAEITGSEQRLLRAIGKVSVDENNC